MSKILQLLHRNFNSKAGVKKVNLLRDYCKKVKVAYPTFVEIKNYYHFADNLIMTTAAEFRKFKRTENLTRQWVAVTVLVKMWIPLRFYCHDRIDQIQKFKKNCEKKAHANELKDLKTLEHYISDVSNLYFVSFLGDFLCLKCNLLDKPVQREFAERSDVLTCVKKLELALKEYVSERISCDGVSMLIGGGTSNPGYLLAQAVVRFMNYENKLTNLTIWKKEGNGLEFKKREILMKGNLSSKRRILESLISQICMKTVMNLNTRFHDSKGFICCFSAFSLYELLDEKTPFLEFEKLVCSLGTFMNKKKVHVDVEKVSEELKIFFEESEEFGIKRFLKDLENFNDQNLRYQKYVKTIIDMLENLHLKELTLLFKYSHSFVSQSCGIERIFGTEKRLLSGRFSSSDRLILAEIRIKEYLAGFTSVVDCLVQFKKSAAF